MDKEFLYTDGKYSSHSGWHIYNSELFDTERKLIKALELLKISENELIEIMRKGDKSDV